MVEEDGRQVDVWTEDRQLTVERALQARTGRNKCVSRML